MKKCPAISPAESPGLSCLKSFGPSHCKGQTELGQLNIMLLDTYFEHTLLCVLGICSD